MTSVLLLTSLYWLTGAEPTAKVADPLVEKERKAAVSVMAPAKAKQLTVKVGEANQEIAELTPEPLLRWSNATAGSIYGEVFVWSQNQRPVAVASIYRWFDPFKDSTVEIVSLSESTIQLAESQKDLWTSPPRGVTYRKTSAPPPAMTRGMRLTQMRALATRFSAELADDRGGEQVRRELRLLNQPIHRYEDPKHGLLAGAIFAFVESTDPEALVILEAVNENGLVAWRYGLARMNAHAMVVRHDKGIVQTWERVNDPARNAKSPYAFFNFDPAEVKIGD